MELTTAKQWKQKGTERIAEEDYVGAEEAFSKSLSLQEDVYCRNNLALAVFLQGEPERAFQCLEPALGEESVHSTNLFTQVLAAQLLAALGQIDAARKHLNKGIRLFQRLMVKMKGQREKDATNEYTVTIMKAAGEMGDHRQVLNLFRRWEKYHTSWHNRYLAGVAAFNMGYYSRADSNWSSISLTRGLVSSMKEVAMLVDQGIIPSFSLEYDFQVLSSEIFQSPKEDESRKKMAESGLVRMMFFHYLLGQEIHDSLIQYFLETLIRYGGSWGIQLGTHILQSTVFSPSFKMFAARSLVKCGALPQNAPVSMLIDGQEEMVEINQSDISFDKDLELEMLLIRAETLLEMEEKTKTISMLEEYRKKNKNQSRVMKLLAILYLRDNALDKALPLFETLEKRTGDNPTVLFYLASLWLQKNEVLKAHQYFNRIDPRGESMDFHLRYWQLLEQIEQKEGKFLQEDKYLFIFREQEDKRLQIEEKPLPLDASLRRGLKNMPVQWLGRMISVYGLPSQQKRKDREEEIVAHVTQINHLKEILQEKIQAEHRELLHFLLKKECWTRINIISRYFGSMRGDGFSWNEDPPTSTLGHLWSLGLVLVGKTRINERNSRFVTIPTDLRQPLAELIGTQETQLPFHQLDSN